MLLLILLAAASSLLLTPLVRELTLRWGFVDIPSGGRRIHARPIPRTGGVALLLSVIISCVLAGRLSHDSSQQISEILASLQVLVPAVIVIFLTGLADDVRGLRPSQKLAAQTFASLLAYQGGVRVTGIAGISFPESATIWWSLPLTLVWLILCTNAFNLIDGLDGLAAGAGLLAATTVALAALVNGDTALAMAAAPILGCLIGFLRYNFHPASIFLGDCGSLMIGFVLGCFGIIWSHKSATLFGMAAPAMAFALPLLDVGLAVIRRFFRRQPIFSADRGHIHHHLLDLGFTVPRAVLTLYAISAIGAAWSLIHNRLATGLAVALATVFAIAIYRGVRYAGYREFDVLCHFFSDGAFRHIISGQLKLHGLEAALLRARTTAEFAAAVKSGAREIGLEHVEILLEGAPSETSQQIKEVHWELSLPLAEQGRIVIQQRGTQPESILLPGLFVGVVRDAYARRFGEQTRLAKPHVVPSRRPEKVVSLSAEIAR